MMIIVSLLVGIALVALYFVSKFTSHVLVKKFGIDNTFAQFLSYGSLLLWLFPIVGVPAAAATNVIADNANSGQGRMHTLATICLTLSIVNFLAGIVLQLHGTAS
jgi:hypothetical protein